MTEKSIMEQKFSEALRKLEANIQKGKVDKADMVGVEVWGQMLHAKKELERERDAKDVTGCQ